MLPNIFTNPKQVLATRDSAGIASTTNSRLIIGMEIKLYARCVQPFSPKGPQPLLWGGWWTVPVKFTVLGILNSPKRCVIFILYMQFTDLAAGGVTQPVGPRVEYPYSMLS